MNIYDNFTRQKYDKYDICKKSYKEVQPGFYVLDPHKNINCNRCLSLHGQRPSSGANSFGVSTPNENGLYRSDQNVELENKLTGRIASRKGLKGGRVTYIDMENENNKLRNHNLCSKVLNTHSTLLDFPIKNDREMPINRFYDTGRPMELVYDRGNSGSITRLEARDNHKPTSTYSIEGMYFN